MSLALELAETPPAQDGCFWAGPRELAAAALSSIMRKAVAHGQR